VLVRCKLSRHGPEMLQPAGLDMQSENFGVLALEYRVGCACIRFGQELDRFSAHAKGDRDVDSADGRGVVMSGIKVK